MKKTPMLFICMAMMLAMQTKAERLTEIFVAPQQKELLEPLYPPSAAQWGSEGWVMINYMVDTTGEVFEPTVISSAGPKSFERAALKAINESTFKPAEIDGKPVQGSGYIRYSFVLKDSSGAAPTFIRLYKALMKALEEEDKEAADGLLEKLSDRTFYRHYESSYLSVAKSRYAAAYGSTVNEMEHLKDALHHDNYYKNNAQALPDDFQQIARRRLFSLEVEHKRYADAMLSYQSMKEAYGEDFVKPFSKAYRQMTDLASNEAPYSVPLTLDENGYAFFNLHKPGIYFNAEPSALQEIKLRCRTKYIFFGFEHDKHYKIPYSWRPCHIEILGKSNAAFEVVQFE